MSNPVPERPLGMSALMVRAYNAGLKGETRRAMAVQPPAWCKTVNRVGPWHHFEGDHPEGKCGHPKCACIGVPGPAMWTTKCKYGKPGDELYFTEAWRTIPELDPCRPIEVNRGRQIFFEADGTHSHKAKGKLRQGRFMCRWMSRARHIPIISIHAERLGDISEEDAENEGVDGWCPYGTCGGNGVAEEGRLHVEPTICRCANLNFREVYSVLWEHINGPGSWARDKDKWVWVIRFPKHKP